KEIEPASECPVSLVTVQKASYYVNFDKVDARKSNDNGSIRVTEGDTIISDYSDGRGIGQKLVRDTAYQKAYQVKLDGSTIAVHFCEKQTDNILYRFDDAHLYLNSSLTEKSGLALRDGGDGKHVFLELPNGISYQIKNAGSGIAVRLEASAK
ncbi:MAG: hypothetical protein ACRCYO_11220, partial [Bacteroidia bacterium]